MQTKTERIAEWKAAFIEQGLNERAATLKAKERVATEDRYAKAVKDGWK